MTVSFRWEPLSVLDLIVPSGGFPLLLTVIKMLVTVSGFTSDIAQHYYVVAFISGRTVRFCVTSIFLNVSYFCLQQGLNAYGDNKTYYMSTSQSTPSASYSSSAADEGRYNLESKYSNTRYLPQTTSHNSDHSPYLACECKRLMLLRSTFVYEFTVDTGISL